MDNRFMQIIIGLIVAVFLLSEPLRLFLQYMSGMAIPFDADYKAAITAMATMIAGAIVKDMISPTRASEQRVKELEATAAVVAVAPEGAKAEAAKAAQAIAGGRTARQVADTIAAAGAEASTLEPGPFIKGAPIEPFKKAPSGDIKLGTALNKDA